MSFHSVRNPDEMPIYDIFEGCNGIKIERPMKRDRHCPGDIQRAEWTTARKQRPESSPALPDPGDPLVIS